MNRIILAIALAAGFAANTHARLMSTCGGAVFSVQKHSGMAGESVSLPELQVGGPLPTITMSDDGQLLQVSYATCRPNTKKGAPDKLLPVEWPNAPSITTKTFSLPGLHPSTTTFSGGRTMLVPLTREGEELETFRVGDWRLVYDGEGRICFYGPDSKDGLWCHTVDPFAHKRAGGSLRVDIYQLEMDFLVVTDFSGAFRLSPETGQAKWHFPYSNLDAVPRVFDEGAYLIFAPSQEFK